MRNHARRLFGLGLSLSAPLVVLATLQTALPLPGSPAINAADTAACPPLDERGFLRLAPCDIGAVERVFPNWLPMLGK